MGRLGAPLGLCATRLLGTDFLDLVAGFFEVGSLEDFVVGWDWVVVSCGVGDEVDLKIQNITLFIFILSISKYKDVCLFFGLSTRPDNA